MQRLAVAPGGAAPGSRRALLTDGLRWLRSHGARRAYVNTQDDNDRASRSTAVPASRSCPSVSNVWGESCEAPSASSPTRRAVLAATAPSFTSASRARRRRPLRGRRRGRSPPVSASCSQSPWVAAARDVHDEAPPRQPGARGRARARRSRSPCTSRRRRGAASTTSSRTAISAAPLRTRTRSRSRRCRPTRSDNVTDHVRALRVPTLRPTIGINRPGVYPSKVELVNTGARVGIVRDVARRGRHPRRRRRSTRSSRSRSSGPACRATRSTHADGTDDPRVVAQLKPGGRLDKIATCSPRTEGFRCSLAVGPETVESWKRARQARPASSRPAFKARAAAVANRRPPGLARDRTCPIDSPRVEAAGLGEHLAAAVRHGSRACCGRVRRRTRRRPRSPRSSTPCRRPTRSSNGLAVDARRPGRGARRRL